MNQDASPKVLRWKWDVQQYNFKVEHIPGKENVIADLMSRLCIISNGEVKRHFKTRGEVKRHFNTPRHIRTKRKQNLRSRQRRAMIKQMEETQKNLDDLQINPATVLATLAADTLRVKSHHWQEKNQPTTAKKLKLFQSVHGWHNNCHHGHGGVERTLDLLRAKVPLSREWVGMRQDVKTFISQCPQCQFMQASANAIRQKAQLHPFNIGANVPWKRIAMDSMGPFTEDKHGNKYILVTIDEFSGYVTLKAIPNLTAELAAQKLVETFGEYCATPDEIKSDNGTQFNNELISCLTELMITDQVKIIPYSHEENGIVERANKEILRHLRAIVFDRKIQTYWSIALPLIQRLINTTIRSTIGTAPASIMYGTNVHTLERKLLYPSTLPNGNPIQKYPDYIIELLKVQAEIIARATTIHGIISRKHISKKMKNLTQPQTYNINDYVIWEYPEGLRKDSRPNKLASHYRGPFRIININDIERTLTIQNLVTDKCTDVLITQVIPFRFDPNLVDPKEVALQAAGEFEVEDILDIKGTRNHNRRYDRRNLMLKIRWAGYDESYDTWEPWGQFKGNLRFLDFCKRKNLKYLIDKNLFESQELATLTHETISYKIKPKSILSKKRKRSDDHSKGQRHKKIVRFYI